MPLVPPFSIHDIEPLEGHGKRSAVGTETGITLGPWGRPHATMHVTYRENFRLHRIYRIESPTPSWPAGADGKWATTPRGPTLPPGTLVVQTEPNDRARQDALIGGGARTELVLGQLDSAAVTPGGLSKSLEHWVPLRNHPDGDPAWIAPKLVRRAPINQWGVTGDLDFKLDPYGSAPVVKHYKMVTVWERWTKCLSFPCEEGAPKGPGRWTQGLFTLRPGVHAGYVKVMPRHSSESERKKFPSILVAWTWDEVAHAWVENAASAKNAAVRVPGCFVHPGEKPSAFLGCLSPGPIDKATPWGFWQVKYCREAMWSMLNDLGVDEAGFEKLIYPSAKTARWVLIRVDDPDDVCGIRNRGRVDLMPIGPRASSPAAHVAGLRRQSA